MSVGLFSRADEENIVVSFISVLGRYTVRGFESWGEEMKGLNHLLERMSCCTGGVQGNRGWGSRKESI